MNTKFSRLGPRTFYALLAITSSFFAACGLDENGTTNVTGGSASSTAMASSSSSSSSSGAGGDILTGSSSSGNGGAGSSVSSSSTSSTSSSSTSTGCPQCMIGAPGSCMLAPMGHDDCPTQGELCNAAGFCECGVSRQATVLTCPPGWDGSVDGKCILDCNFNNACKNFGIILCPPGRDCLINCSGTSSCTGNTVIQCSPGYACEINCSNSGSCNNIPIKCSDDGPCTVNCSGDSTACTSTKVDCGNNACVATCNNGSEKPVLTQRAGTKSCKFGVCP